LRYVENPGLQSRGFVLAERMTGTPVAWFNTSEGERVMSTATSAAGSAPTSKQQDKPESTGWWDMLKQTWKDFSEDNAMRLAAAMACYIMLALAPMIVVTLKVISVVPFLKAKTNEIVTGQATSLLGAQSSAAIQEMVKHAQQPGQGTVATIVSLVIVVFSASGVFVSLQDALNTIWEVKPKPNAGWWQWFRKRFLSVGMVFGIGLLLLSSMAVTSVLHVIIDSVFGHDRAGFAKVIAYLVDFVATVAVAWVLFMGVFKFLPDAKVSWNDVWFGALVTAVLFKVGQILMAIYFAKGSATSAYGAFGSIIAVLLWAYYSSIIMFLGAEFTQVWAKAHGREIEPEEHAVKVTEDDRAQQGIPSEKRVGAKAAKQGTKGGGTAPSRPQPRPYGVPQPAAIGYVPPGSFAPQDDARKPYTFGAAGAAVGAVAAGLATWYYATDPRRLTKKRAVEMQLDQRVREIEAKVGRVNRLKEYLAQMDVKERIDRVEHEIQRAGRHVRAQDTGRPLWMVRLADLIGGRWSNL
jgi:membrane protein